MIVNSNDRDKRLGATTKVDLTAPFNLNTNPTQIIWEQANYVGWNAFQAFLAQKREVNDPEWNTLSTSKDVGVLNSLSEKYINEFNEGVATSGEDSTKVQITLENIVAAQAYHKAQPQPPGIEIFVDGWVGSQTSRMRYPGRPNIFYLSIGASLRTKSEAEIKEITQGYKNKNPWLKNIYAPSISQKERGKYEAEPVESGAYFPVLWGSTRFVVKAFTLFNLLNGYNEDSFLKWDLNRVYNYKTIPTNEWTSLSFNDILKRKIPYYGVYPGLELYDPNIHTVLELTAIRGLGELATWEKASTITVNKTEVLNNIDTYNAKVKKGQSDIKLAKNITKPNK